MSSHKLIQETLTNQFLRQAVLNSEVSGNKTEYRWGTAITCKIVIIHPKSFTNIGQRFMGIWFGVDTPLIFLVIEYYATYVTYNTNKYTNNRNQWAAYSEQVCLPLPVKENSKCIQAPQIHKRFETIIKINNYTY
jgi:hypothetical protein